MNKAQFLAKLRDALSGLGAAEIDEIVADYDAHFSEALAAGRSEADVAAALGEPVRLAKELKAEAGFKRLEQKPTPKNAVLAISAFLGLATLNVFIVLPLALAIFALFFAFAIVVFVLFGVGVGLFFGGLADAGYATALAGFGLFCGAVGIGALWLLAAGGLAQLAVRYGRLHYTVLKPALEE